MGRVGYPVAVAVAGCFLLAPTSAIAASPVCFGTEETLDYELTVEETIGVCFDDDTGDTVTIEVTQAPTKGDVDTLAGAGEDPAFIEYTPDTLGADTIKFRATDGTNTSNEVTVTTNNIPFTDDPPTCFGSELPDPDTFEVGEQTPLGACFDPEGQNLDITITQQGTHGAATVVDDGTPDPQVLYTASDATADDTVKFKANDGTNDSAVFTATTHNVPFLNDTPICFSEGGTFDLFVPTIAGGCEDDEDDLLTMSIVQSPGRGTTDVLEQGSRSPALFYTARLPGADVFRFRASDGNTTSEPVTVTTDNVGTLPNRAPQCPPNIRRLAAVGEARDFGCDDPDGDPVTYTIVQGPTKGTVAQIPSSPPRLHLLRYTARQTGLDVVRFRASDGKGGASGVITATFTNRPLITGGSSAGTATSDSRGNITLKTRVDCAGANDGPDCRVSTTARTRKRKRNVKLGKSAFVVKAGTKGKVRVKLSKKGLKLLKRSRRIKAVVTIDATRGVTKVRQTVKVTLKAPKRRKKR